MTRLTSLTKAEAASLRRRLGGKEFARGDVAQAGAIIGAEQQRAAATGDEESLATLSEWVQQLRSLVSDDPDKLAAFDRSVATRDPQRTRDNGPAVWVTFGVIVLIAVGAFGPWATALGISESGTAGSNDGWFLVGFAVVSAFSAWGYRTSGSLGGSLGLSVLIALAGIAGVGVTLHDRLHVEHLGQSVPNLGFTSGLVQVGWGLNLDLVASAALIVMACVLLFRPPSITAQTTDTGPAPVVLSTEAQAVAYTATANEVSRLQRLQELRERGLITDEEFAAKRIEILDQI